MASFAEWSDQRKKGKTTSFSQWSDERHGVNTREKTQSSAPTSDTKRLDMSERRIAERSPAATEKTDLKKLSPQYSSVDLLNSLQENKIGKTAMEELESESQKRAVKLYQAPEKPKDDYYNSLVNRPDYKSLSAPAESKRTSETPNLWKFWEKPGDDVYDFINDIKKEGGDSYRNTVGATSLATGQKDKYGDYTPYTFMSKDEIGTYNYLYAREGKDAADEYLEHLKPLLGQRQFEDETKMLQERAEEYPVLMSIASAPDRLTSGVAGFIDLLGQNAKRAVTREPVNYNTPAMRAAQASGTVREAVSDKIDNPVGSFLYNTGMSGGESLIANLIPGGQFFLGAAAATSTARDIHERGGSDNQALVGGLAAGALEAIFERLSLGNFNKLKEVPVKGIKDIAKNIAKSMGVNASEEMFTEIANTIFDSVAMGDVSNWNLAVHRYMFQGLSEAEAKKQAAKDIGVNIGMAGLAGGVMGVGFAGIGSTQGWLNNRGKNINGGNENATVQQPQQPQQPQQQSTAVPAAVEPAAAAPTTDATDATVPAVAVPTVEPAAPAQVAADALSRGSGQRNAGVDTGGQVGSVAEGARGNQARAIQDATARRRRNSISDSQSLTVPARSLGITNASADAAVVVMPDKLWDDEMRTTAGRVTKETGKPVTYFAGSLMLENAQGEPTTVKGAITQDRVLIQADNFRYTVDQIADHEIFHYYAEQQAGLVESIRESINSQYGENELTEIAGKYDAAYHGAYDAFGQEGTTLVLEEIFADAYAGINTHKSNASKYTDAVKQTLTEYTPAANHAAESDGVHETRGPPTESYSIQEDASGGRYVSVDVDQHLFDGLTPTEMRPVARRAILDKFRGKVIGTKNRAYVTRESAEEYTYPATRRTSENVIKAKLRTAPELDNLMDVAQFVRHEDDDGRHPDATRGWDKYNVKFEVGGEMFTGQISVIKTDRGDVFYDLSNIKNISAANRGDIQNNGNPRSTGNVSTNSIRDGGENVNTKFSVDDAAGAFSEENGKFYIKDVSALSKSDLTKIGAAMRKKGYDWRDADDVRGLLERIKGHGGLLQGEQVTAIKQALGLELQSKTGVTTPETYKAAIREFGTTTQFSEAGYLLTDGKLLDFSGKREGAPAGSRSMDHREIERVYDKEFDSQTDAMIEFMNEGNIRMLPEYNGINLSVAPNSRQEAVLNRYITNANGEVVLDLDGEVGNTIYSVEYPVGTKPSKVISDIRNFFENGTEPVISDIGRFRYSVDDATDETTIPSRKDIAKTETEARKTLTTDVMSAFSIPGKNKPAARTALNELADKMSSGRATETDIRAAFDVLFANGEKRDFHAKVRKEYKEIAKFVKGKKIFVPDYVRAEYADDWNNIRKQAYGKRIYLMNDTSKEQLNTLNDELAERFPGYFNTSLQSDMKTVIDKMLEYAELSKPKISLEEEARRHGGDEAVEAYRREMMEDFDKKLNDYYTTVRGAQKQRSEGLEKLRADKKNQLRGYIAHAREVLRGRAEKGLPLPKGGEKQILEPLPEGFSSVEEYTTFLDKRAAAAKAQRLANTPEQHLKTKTAEDIEWPESMKDLNIAPENNIGIYAFVDSAMANHRAAHAMRKVIENAERRLLPTEKEKHRAAEIVTGMSTEANIAPNEDADKIMQLAEYYWAEQALGTNLIQQTQQDIKSVLSEKMEDMFKDSDSYEPPKAITLNTMPPERSMREIFGDKLGKKIFDKIFWTVSVNEAKRNRWVNEMYDAVRYFTDSTGKQRRMTREESAVTHRYIEGKNVADKVAKMEMSAAIKNAAENIRNGQDIADVSIEFSLGREERRYAELYSRWLETEEMLKGEDIDETIVENASAKYKEMFNQFYKATNAFLVAHGYEPIGFIEGYAPHMQSQENLSVLSNVLNALGVKGDVTTLPTEKAGKTKDFKPNKRWNPFHQTRTSDVTDYDIEKAYERYVDHMSDIVYHTDDIMHVRAASKHLREKYTKTEISANIESAIELRYAKLEEKRNFLIKKGEIKDNTAAARMTAADINRMMDKYVEELISNNKNLSKYGDFVTWLDNYANNLAAKQSNFDREMEGTLGRESLNLGNKLVRMFARTQVAGNFASAVNQVSQLPAILAKLGGNYSYRAMKDIASGKLRRAAWAQESDFLTTKKGIDFLVYDKGQLALEKMYTPLEYVDGFVSALAVRGQYLKELDAGKSHKEAMKAADMYARRVMGSREKGTKPLWFEQKNVLAQMVNIFQIESFNMAQHIRYDMPYEYKKIADEKGAKEAAKWLAKIATGYLLLAFFINRMTEETTGGTPVPYDLIGGITDFISEGQGMSTNKWLLTYMDSALEKMTGERTFGTDDKKLKDGEFDWGAAFSKTGQNIINDIPFFRNVSALAGWGDETLPLPDFSGATKKIIDTAVDDGVISLEMGAALRDAIVGIIPGGRQINKTLQGIETMVRGGKYKGYDENSRLQYPVNNDIGDLWSWMRGAQAVAFGNNALSENRDFYASDDTAFTKERTALYDSLVKGGADRKELYNAIQDWRRVGGDTDAELTSYEKGLEQRNIIRDLNMTDEQKLELYRGLSGENAESRMEKLQTLLDTGMTWDDAMDAYDKYAELNATTDKTAGTKATEYALWADKQGYTKKQAAAVKEQFVFFSHIPAEATRYTQLTDAGLNADKANQLTTAISDLEPLAGKSTVTPIQRYKAVTTARLTSDEQMAALSTLMKEPEYAKLEAAYGYDITPAQYIQAKEYIGEADDNDAVDQRSAELGINLMSALTREQKAVLWQLQNSGWSYRSNPYSQTVGRKVVEALGWAKETKSSGTSMGLSLPDPPSMGLSLPEPPSMELSLPSPWD